MKNEAEFCTVVKNSMINGFKIPDPSDMFNATSKRCFDGIGTLMIDDKLTFVCWEAKYLKSMSAFNFNRIEEHQNYYLTEFHKAESIKSYLIVGVNCGRADIRVFVFDWNEKFSELYKNGFSIHKKYLEKMPYNKVSKGIFKFENIVKYDELISLINV